MNDLLGSAAIVSDDEVRSEFLGQNEKTSIGYAMFTPAMFKDAGEPTQAEVDKFLAEKKDAAQAHYQRTAFMYAEPRSAQTRRILVKVPPDADEAAARTRAEQARGELGAGKDFAEVARTYSDDEDSKAKGGDIGWVAPGKSAFGRVLEEEVTKLEKGGLSPVFRDRLGFQIVRVDDVKPASQKSFEEVAPQVARQILGEEKSREAARKKAEETLKKVRTAADLKKLYPPLAEGELPDPNALKPFYRETTQFSPSDGSVPGLGAVPAIARLAFALTPEQAVAKEPLEERGAFFVVTLVERTRADLAELQKDMDKWRDQAKRRKQFELFQNLVMSLRANARIEENPAVVAYSDQPPPAQQ
jgi:peptidyl-prolyl cis-trans isomerase D